VRATTWRGERVGFGLVTVAPDDLDWEDEIRIAIEERVSLSPDALTGMEASLRFAGNENLLTKIFWTAFGVAELGFCPADATGEQGALKIFWKKDQKRNLIGREFRNGSELSTTRFPTMWIWDRTELCSER